MRSRNGRRQPQPWTPLPGSPEWWRTVLASVKERAERSDVPIIQAATAQVPVDATPDEAFRIFTEEIGLWWRRGTPYWNDAERGLTIRLEPGVGGRFIEVYDLDTETGFEVGRVTAWEPGRRLAFTWSCVGWPEGVKTDVEVIFEPEGEKTVVTLRHSGFERLGPDGEQLMAGYDGGWKEVVGWFAERINAPAP
jgi:uncharacterized protein YndB with AHSA1/START domain